LEALVCLDKALALDPNSSLAWNDKGYSLLLCYRAQEALACFDRALSSESTLSAIWRNRGMALHDLGRYAESRQSFEKAVDLGENGLSSAYLVWLRGVGY
jgi:tetratricopeptide (TPR) repeat protein